MSEPTLEMMAKKETTTKAKSSKTKSKPKAAAVPKEEVIEAVAKKPLPKPRVKPKTAKNFKRGNKVEHTHTSKEGKVMFVHKDRVMVDFGATKYYCEPKMLKTL